MSKEERFEFWENNCVKGITDFQDGSHYITTNLDDMKDLTDLLNMQDRMIELREKKAVTLEKEIQELKKQLENAIVPKFKIGDYFIEYWDKTPSIYQYQGNNHFKCLNKYQGYHCDYVILGALLLDEGFIEQISKEEAQAKLEELKGENK